MARKPETVFIASVHRYIAYEEPYFEKMHNDYRGGTPDVYYEGNPRMMWIEYKWYDKLPKVMRLYDLNTKVHLSKLQQGWLLRAHNNGRDVGVIVGYPDGGIILPGMLYKQDIERKAAEEATMSRAGVAQWIVNRVMEGK